MADVTVPWGDETWTIPLPPEWTVQQVAQSETAPAPDDWPDRMGRALAEPVSGPPLSKLLAARRGGRVAIIVEDLTRHSPLETILPIILREIRHAGLADNQVEIFFAGGMHPPMTPREVAGKLGGGADGIAWRCNPWKDATAYDSVGRVGRLKVAIDRRV
ncbi:MAG: lactate racemase domain-containing protein, partial [Planctomycetota bacterium]